MGASSDGLEKHKGNERGWDGVLRKPVLNWEVPGAEMSLVQVIIWACRPTLMHCPADTWGLSIREQMHSSWQGPCAKAQ